MYPREGWCPRSDSNQRPTDYKSVALPAELQGLFTDARYITDLKALSSYGVWLFFRPCINPEYYHRAYEMSLWCRSFATGGAAISLPLAGRVGKGGGRPIDRYFREKTEQDACPPSAFAKATADKPLIPPRPSTLLPPTRYALRVTGRSFAGLNARPGEVRRTKTVEGEGEENIARTCRFIRLFV